METLSQCHPQCGYLSSRKGLYPIKESPDIVYQCGDDAMLMVSGNVVMELFPKTFDGVVLR